MSMITISKHEDVPEIRSKILHRLKSIKALSSKKYSGKLKLREDPVLYQKHIRQEWNEHSDYFSADTDFLPVEEIDLMLYKRS